MSNESAYDGEKRSVDNYDDTFACKFTSQGNPSPWRRISDYWNHQSRVAYLLITPMMVLLLLFNIIPLFASFVISTLDINIFLTDIKFIGLANYIEAFHADRFWNALLNTIKFTLIEVPIQMSVGLILAALVTKNRTRNKFFRSVYFLPIVCSATVIGIMFQLLCNMNIGLVPYWLSKLGIPKVSFLHDPRFAFPTIIFMSVWRSFGISTIIFVAAMQDVPRELYECAELDGAGKIRQFFSITLPNIVPTIYFVLITRIIGSMQIFDLVYVTTNGGPKFTTETLVSYIYTRAFSTDTRLGYATAVSECLFAIILLISIFLYGKMLKGTEDN